MLSRKEWATCPRTDHGPSHCRSESFARARCSVTGGAVREAGRVEDDALARLDAGPDLDGAAVAGADRHPAQARPAVAHDEEAREAAPLERARSRGR